MANSSLEIIVCIICIIIICHSRSDEKPRLVYGLVLQCGPVWEMKWCPAKAWQRPVNNAEEVIKFSVNSDKTRVLDISWLVLLQLYVSICVSRNKVMMKNWVIETDVHRL